MAPSLLCFAGPKALKIIREKGLQPEMVKVMVSAAGGPRWLVLYHLDRAIFSSWMKDLTGPVFLLGSSIGAWRFTMACREHPAESIDAFLSVFLGQRYSRDPGPREVSMVHAQMLNKLFEGNGIADVLNHPFLRLSIMAARCKWPVASENKVLLGMGLADAVLYNAVNRNGLKFFFERALFYDSRDIPPFFSMNDFPIQRISLSADNLKQAVLASSSVPMIMRGVRNIPGAPKGTYRDGGVIDYHFNIPFMKEEEGVVLFPHYTDRIIPGWFDKRLPWRKPNGGHLENVVFLCPSEEFVKRLPFGKIPDKNDFWHFKGREDERAAYWKKVADESERIAEEFMDLTVGGKIQAAVKPLWY
jgi:hypothetical protein